MNKKAEAFQKYLDEKKIEKVFAVEEITDDEWETVLFRSRIDIHGNFLPTVVIFDNTVYGIVRVQIAPQALSAGNETSVLRYAAEQNRKYKAFKYYFDENGALMLDVCLIGSDTDNLGELVYAMLDVIIGHLNESYKSVMQSIWN